MAEDAALPRQRLPEGGGLGQDANYLCGRDPRITIGVV